MESSPQWGKYGHFYHHIFNNEVKFEVKRKTLSTGKIIFFSQAYLWVEFQFIVENQSMNDKGHTGKYWLAYSVQTGNSYR